MLQSLPRKGKNGIDDENIFYNKLRAASGGPSAREKKSGSH